MSGAEYVWFPWCTSEYKPEVCCRMAQELRERGEYYEVEIRGYRVYVLMRRNDEGHLRPRTWFKAEEAA